MGHSHAHSTIQTPSCHNRAFGIGIALNVGYIVLEVVLGCLTDSLALLADAGHNLSDVFSLLLAWGAASVGARPPSGRRTYGLRRASILAALANAILLLLAIGAIAWEAVQRFAQPSPVPGVTVMWVAGTGVFINGLTALLFMKGRDRDLNIRGAFLHMAADAGVSLGVVGAGLAMLLTGWLWIDPTVSLLIVIVVAVGTWGLLRDSVNLALDTVPPGIDLEAVRGYLHGLPRVTAVHDLHVWGMSTTETALTAHLVRSDSRVDDALLGQAATGLRERFGIGHVTLQVETGDEQHPCRQAREGQV